jgi:glycosyltransferase involved in cell wall biosynthesis
MSGSAHRSNCYPSIDPVPEHAERPYWSVMIPTYHCADYLTRTLRSILAQAPSAADMQIEVVDDVSTKDDPESVVRETGEGRVEFFRQPANVGPQANFTTCARRARGHWVHILHGDDMVRPGFYEAMQRAAASAPAIEAAFCRVITIDESDGWIDLSERESKAPAVIPDLIERLAVYNHIMFPSIVVKRTAYERLGGFHPELFHSADWDMWKRIAAHFAIWHEPEPLALYRIHTMSDTSRLMRTGANIDDACHAIEIAEEYLPPARVRELSKAARLWHALYAVELAHEHAAKGDRTSARAQIRAALRCSASPPVFAAALGYLFHSTSVWSRNQRSNL